MSRRIRVACAAALLALAGCSMEPVYDRPASPVGPGYPTGPAYRGAGNGSGTMLPAVDIGWRDFLTDPRLQRLVELALQDNRDLRVAVLNVAAVRAQYRVQRAALFPLVSGDASTTRTHTPADLSSSRRELTAQDFQVGPSASWEIDLFGRLRSLSDAALQRYFATAQARKAAEILLVSQVADQYLTVLAYDEQLAVTEKTLATARASYQIVQLQFHNGIGSELDVRQAETVVEQAQASHAAQLRARAQAENALVLLVGRPLPADLPPPIRLGDQTILADIPAGLPSDLIARRPDILEAEAELRAENANIGAARAAFFPRITLTGDFGTASATLGGLFAAGSGAWSFAPLLTVPLFDGGANAANLEATRVLKDIGVAQYEKAIQTAFREVADGLAARGTYDDQLAALQRYTFAQQRRLDLANLRYKNGVDSYLNVLTAQTDLYNAQLTLVNARLQRLTNLVDLYRQLGGGWLQRTHEAPRPADAEPAHAQRAAAVKTAAGPAR